jgi:hypothetical protein
LRTSSITGIDLIQGEQISLFPNPVTTRLYIRHNLDILDVIEVFDISGRKVMKENNFTAESIDVSALESGVYLLHVSYKGQKAVYKFIKK